jgi:hypothetical protein
MKKRSNLGKKYAPRLSLYPLTPEKALSAFMGVKLEDFERYEKRGIYAKNMEKADLPKI